MAASASAAAKSTSASTTTTTTLPAPQLAQSTLLFTWSDNQFEDVVLVNVPKAPVPKFFLSLSPDTNTITCGAKAFQPQQNDSLQPQQNDSGVTSFQVTCTATGLPSTFSPSLEVLMPSSLPAFLPVTILNNSHKTACIWLPIILGLSLAAALLFLALIGLWRRQPELRLRRQQQLRHKAAVLRHKAAVLRRKAAVAEQQAEAVQPETPDAPEIVAGFWRQAAESRRNADEFRRQADEFKGQAEKLSPKAVNERTLSWVHESWMINHFGLNMEVSNDLQAWNATDCWATNVGGAVTVLTGVVAATSASGSGALGTLLPGLPGARITIYSSAFAAMLALAPLLYGICKRKRTEEKEPGQVEISEVPTVGGFLVASFVTLTSVFGVLTMLCTLVWLSTGSMMEKVSCWSGLVVIALVFWFYAARSIRLLLETRGRADSLLSPSRKTAAAL